MPVTSWMPIWISFLTWAALLPASNAGVSADCLFGHDEAVCGTPSLAPDSCPHMWPHSHTYGLGGSIRASSDNELTGSMNVVHGVVAVQDANVNDCNGDGIPGDFDGDFEWGVGGAFFGYGHWADEATCAFGLQAHGPSATVNDLVFGANIWFMIGANDMDGPEVTPDPVTGAPACTTDGSITPGDPATDPTADADDCLTPVIDGSQTAGTGTTCGAGGDGGYWVILVEASVRDHTAFTLCSPDDPICCPEYDPMWSVCLNGGETEISNLPTFGTITA